MQPGQAGALEEEGDKMGPTLPLEPGAWESVYWEVTNNQCIAYNQRSELQNATDLADVSV